MAKGKPRGGYRGAEDGDDDEEMKDETSKKNFPLEDYIRIVHKNTEFFSTYDADTLLSVLAKLSDKEGFKFEEAKDRYKAKI